MNASRLLITLARRTTIGCVAVLVALGAGLVGVWTWSASLDKQLAELEGEVRALTGGLDAGRRRLDALAQGKAAYEEAAGLGLIGPSRREAWLQSLFSAYGAVGFQDLPTFKLEKGKRLDGAAAGPAGGSPAGMAPGPGMAPGAPSATPPSAQSVAIYAHDLEFKLLNAHEGDVLSILAALRRDHPGIQRPVGCRLSDPLPKGLSAVCTVRFFNVDVPGSGPSSKAPS